MIIKVILGIGYLFLGFVCLSVYESWNFDSLDNMSFIVVLACPTMAIVILLVMLINLAYALGKIIVKWLDKLMEV